MYVREATSGNIFGGPPFKSDFRNLGEHIASLGEKKMEA